jgi:hypothetical protein
MKKSLRNLMGTLFITCLSIQAAGAQSIGPVGFSLTGDGDLGGKTVMKEEVLHFSQGEAARLLFSKVGFAFMIGDLDGNGLEDLPGNVNAFHVEPTASGPLPSSIFFSFSTDCCGMKDGDVIRFQDTGGLSVHLTEAHFATITGATDGNVDVDAFLLSPGGQTYFSFADNEDSTLLSGSQPGVIGDGAILRVDASGIASILYTEDDVSAMVSNALGKTYKAGDVLGLTVDPASSALLFTVQSPTDHDATIFSDMNGGMVVQGYDEASLGFSNQVEIDGLSLLPVMDDLPALEIEPRYPAQGDTITFTLSGGTPNEPFCLLISGGTVTSLVPPFLGGFGVILLDMTHPYFMAGFQGISNLSAYCNAKGTGMFQTTLPMYPAPLDIHIQAMVPLDRIFSHPITMEMNQ